MQLNFNIVILNDISISEIRGYFKFRFLLKNNDKIAVLSTFVDCNFFTKRFWTHAYRNLLYSTFSFLTGLRVISSSL
jgi:hypothetical protein